MRALIIILLIGGCGDPLLDGDDPGPPSLVLEGRIVGLDPSESDRPTGAALVWTAVSSPRDPLARQTVRLVPDEVGEFQLQVFGHPDRRFVESFGEGADEPAAALAFLAVLESTRAGEAVRVEELHDTVRGLADDHYLLWVHRPDEVAAALGETILNPDELLEGMNLVLGLCRPGRTSQLLVVPPERITVVARRDVETGACIDVFWGDWR